MNLLERPICSKVVEGASITQYIFLKLHKVLLSLLTPRYLLLAHRSFFAVCCTTPGVRFFFLVPCALIGYLTDSLLSAIFHVFLFTGCSFPNSRYLLLVTRYMLLASCWPQIAVCFVSNCSCCLLSTYSSSRQSLSLPSDFRCSTFAASAIALRCSLFAVESSQLP